MEDSIFTKIIKGEIPCHKVYEDEKTLAFLTINPDLPGHTLVIPKLQESHFENLPDEDYQAVFATVKKVAQRVKEVFGTERAVVTIMGFEVPHAHVHVVPANRSMEYARAAYENARKAQDGLQPDPDHDELAKIAQKLAF